LRARHCSTGDILDDEQVPAARKEDVLNALSEMAGKFRNRAGEKLATIKEHSKPLVEATTPSLEALKTYSSGRRAAFSSGNTASLPFLKRAVELDPDFALAQAHLGIAYSGVGESVLANESLTKGYRLANRASDFEKFFITFSYERTVTGNLEKARQICELWRPAELMSRVYQLVRQASTANRYATLFYAEYDPATRCLSYVNAGHNPPVILRKSGDACQVLRLEIGGPPAGLLPHLPQPYQRGVFSHQPGDLVVLFTDGVSESMNVRHEEWGEERLIELARTCLGRPALEGVRRILAAAQAFAEGAPQHDDMTLVVLRVG
jgi:hypothetical protein